MTLRQKIIVRRTGGRWLAFMKELGFFLDEKLENCLINCALTHVKERSEKFDWFISEFRSMKVLKTEYPWFESLMERLSSTARRRGKNPKTTTTTTSKRCLC